MIKRNDYKQVPYKPSKPIAPEKTLIKKVSKKLDSGVTLKDLIDFAKDIDPSLVKIDTESYYDESWHELSYEVMEDNKDYDEQYALYLRLSAAYEKNMKKYLDYKKRELEQLEQEAKL